MKVHRLLAAPAFLALVVCVCTVITNRGFSQGTDTSKADTSKTGTSKTDTSKTDTSKTDTSKTDTSKTATQTPNAPSTAGTIVASPGSTVVVPASSSASSTNGGLIVAAPGSTVVVQTTQAASTAKTSATPKVNTFTQADNDVVQDLSAKAKDITLDFRVRIGCIDALAVIGGDQNETQNIVKGLIATLEVEFPNSAYRKVDESKLICFHVVEAVGNLGWGARSAIGQIQSLRGDDVILNTAITTAVTAIKNAPQPQQQQGKQGADSMNPGNTPLN